MAKNFDELIHVLSSIRHVKDRTPRPPLKLESTGKSHLSLLDHIALILVTKAKGDVAATAMIQNTETLIMLYAKNAPCSKQFREYLDKFFKIVATPDDSMQYMLLEEILMMCGDTFRRRVSKCQQALL